MHLHELQTPSLKLDCYGHRVRITHPELLTVPLIDHVLQLNPAATPFSYDSHPDDFAVITKDQTPAAVTFAFTRKR